MAGGDVRRKRTARVRRIGQRGATLIEFALCALVLVLFLLSGIEMDRLILVYSNMANAAAEGERYASVHGSQSSSASGPGADPSDIVTTVKNYLTGIDQSSSHLTVHVTYDDGTNTPGSHVKVLITYNYDPWVSGLMPSGLTLTAVSEGMITY